MERLCEIKNCLISAAQSQMSNLANCDAEELGEVIDMIKDIEEAIYYYTITEAMKETENNSSTMYYKESIRKRKRNVPMDYYHRYEEEDETDEYPVKIYDSREGRSPERRKMYMESKQLHHDQAKKMKELEEYMKELNQDILEMIEDASPEEKQLLQKKIALLATKINV